MKKGRKILINDLADFAATDNIANQGSFAKKINPKGVESLKYIFSFFMALGLLIGAIFSEPILYPFAFIFGVTAFYFYFKEKQKKKRKTKHSSLNHQKQKIRQQFFSKV